MADYEFITYELLDEGQIARIMLNRPEARNAQNRGMLVELHEAFLAAEADDEVRVVILGGMGPMFSAGHDMGSKKSLEELTPGPNQHATRGINGGTRLGAENRMLQEWHYYFENTRRWRNLRKITVAQVHGDVYAAGLMLMWACDLIVAADDVTFADVVGTRLGMCGVEYFAHPWEFGPRKTKELMLTGDSLSVDEAHALGMVSKVFPEAELGERTLEFARRIAQLPTMAALLIKESVNQTRGQHGLLQRPQRLLHPPRAQPLALGRGAREQVPRRPRGGRHPQLEGRPADRPRGEGQGARRWLTRRRQAGRRARRVERPRALHRRRARPSGAARSRCSPAARSASSRAPRRPATAPLAIECDVTDAASCRAAIDEAADGLGGIDALVYTPGIGHLSRIEDTDAATWQPVFATNVIGASIATAAALPHLEESSGVAMFLSSVSASQTPPWPGLGSYAVSKAALDKLVEAWRAEHPDVGFTRIIVGECGGGEGDAMTGFADDWNRDLLGDLVGTWVTRGYMTGALMDVDRARQHRRRHHPHRRQRLHPLGHRRPQARHPRLNPADPTLLEAATAVMGATTAPGCEAVRGRGRRGRRRWTCRRRRTWPPCRCRRRGGAARGPATSPCGRRSWRSGGRGCSRCRAR